MQKIITLLVTTAIGFLCGVIYFPENLVISIAVSLFVGVLTLTEIEVYHIDTELKNCAKELHP